MLFRGVIDTVGDEVSVGSITDSVAVAVRELPAASRAVAMTVCGPSVPAVYVPRPLSSSGTGVPPTVKLKDVTPTLSLAITSMYTTELRSAGLLENAKVTVGATVSALTVS